MSLHNNFYSIILAAGTGTRMKSNLPKVLHKVAHKPMLCHILDQINSLHPVQNFVVYGYQGNVVQQALVHYDNITWAYQEQQLGTAHAVSVGARLLPQDLPTLVSFSDNPLIQASTISKLFDQLASGSDLVLLTTILDNPFGYGRVVRDTNDNIMAIVEEKDASPEQRLIKEVYPGILVAKAHNLQQLLSQVDNNNAQHEYYLTDIIKLAYQAGQKITSVTTDPREVSSANDKYQLAQLEDFYQQDQIARLTRQGLILRSTNPASFSLRGELTFGTDCEVDLNCIFNGKVTLGNNVKIGAGCILTDVVIGDNVVIEPYSVIEKSEIQSQANIGPFARIRPNTLVKPKAKVGNFVETKNVVLGEGSKASHLTYLGDATIGSKVNIGAGVITCNYDGANKFKTVIGNDVFVGSDCQLVAPVTVADGATIAAGTTVVQDISSPSLIYNKKEVVTKSNWQRPVKKTS